MLLLWPIHFASVPLSSHERPALESPEWGEDLARIGLVKNEFYLRSVLPRELELDPQLQSEFREADHSRMNLAFLRWQKRVFADRENISVGALTSRGERAPRYNGLDYTWDELYTSPSFQRLLARITDMSKLFLKRSGYIQIPKQFRIFVWVEVYRQGDGQRPISRIDGAYAMGKYFASVQKGSLKLNFEDPRGINPPYGKTFSHAAYEGNMVMYPSWVSTFITPNMKNYTSVVYTFVIYPADGKKLEWRDDPSAGLEVPRMLQTAAPGQGSPGAGRRP